MSAVSGLPRGVRPPFPLPTLASTFKGDASDVLEGQRGASPAQGQPVHCHRRVDETIHHPERYHGTILSRS